MLLETTILSETMMVSEMMMVSETTMALETTMDLEQIMVNLTLRLIRKNLLFTRILMKFQKTLNGKNK